MIERVSQLKRRRGRGEGGFTLIELLVVITILGILAAVVVFAVSGVNDRGKTSAAVMDARTLRTAEEVHCQRFGYYGSEAELVTAGLLQGQSSYNDVVLTSGGNCTAGGAASADKSGFALGFAEANAGQPIPATVKIPAVSNSSGFPQPINMNKGPAFNVNSYMMDSLLWRDGAGQTVNLLASGYDHTPGTNTWVFHLRTGVSWHDGQPFSAADVQFTVNYLKTGGIPSLAGSDAGQGQGTQGLYKPNLADITDVTISGNDVTFTLATENNAFIPFVAMQMPIMPAHIWSGIPAATALTKNDPAAYIGTGPYKYTGTGPWPNNGAVSLTRNDSYFLGQPKVATLQMVAVSPGQEATLLSNGTVDVTGPNTPTNANLNAFGSFPKVVAPGASNSAIHFNLLHNFPFGPGGAPTVGGVSGDVLFRQAVAYAVDHAALINTQLNGHGIAGSMGGLAPYHPSVAGSLPTYGYNVDTANALLDSIGVVDGADADSTREWPAGTNLNITLWENGGTGTTVSAATNQVVPMLNAVGLGVTAQAEANTGGANDTRLKNGNYDMAVVGYGNLNADVDWLRTRFDNNGVGTGNFFNILGFNNAAFHAAATAQLTDATPADRKAHAITMQQIIAQNALVIPYYLADIYTFYRSSFTPWYYTPGGLPVGPPSVYNKLVYVTAKQW